ncbi:probable serine/threonine-protein kinase [Tanacetum coccineum]
MQCLLSRVGRSRTYSSVYKARDLTNNKIVALKRMRFDNMDYESVKFMAREILILRKLDHPNIIKLEGLITSRHSCSLYLDSCHYPGSSSQNHRLCFVIVVKEDQIWLEFKEFDKGIRKYEVTNSEFEFYDEERRSIGVDHPIVCAVATFAIAAFNKAFKKVKKL